MSKVRFATNKLIDLVDEGILDAYTVLVAALNYMSESDVADLAHVNEFFYEDDEDDDKDQDDDEDDYDDRDSYEDE